jgi:hypothetical protein
MLSSLTPLLTLPCCLIAPRLHLLIILVRYPFFLLYLQTLTAPTANVTPALKATYLLVFTVVAMSPS